MNAITNEILEMLTDDIVSHGLLVQCVEQVESDANSSRVRVRNTLAELLASGRVEVGVARLATPDYVEFVAWKGTVDERVRRAIEAASSVSGPDEEFAYWLCLRENVDRFEGESADL